MVSLWAVKVGFRIGKGSCREVEGMFGNLTGVRSSRSSRT